MENTFIEQPKRLFTFETFYQSDDETWPDQQKDNDKDKDIWRTPSKSDPVSFETFDQSNEMTNKQDNDFWKKNTQRTTLEIWDCWGTFYISDNWEQQSQRAYFQKEWQETAFAAPPIINIM